jgi:peptidoglycan/LPS O-acetylase OafA/YrhL
MLNSLRYGASAMSHTKPSAYRPDIDGLRALAVLPVLLYHAHVPGFSGGFVGVDIFFVISGFLITGIIAREIDAGTFSILHFYERRARRILPALFVVVAFVLLLASWLYLPGDFEDVPKSALAALGFLANVYLFTETGYFQAAAETKPLLHTWSLGVEEQFYIAFPILLMLIARYLAGWRIAAVAGIAAVSLIWAIAKQADTDGFAFYMLPTRAWEMMAGSLLALGAVPQVRARWAKEALSWAGLLAIIAATTLYSKETIFPGIAALPPVLGAAILIHCAPGTTLGKALSSKWPVAIGLISYSLYLWHWPLIVFTEYAQLERLAGWQSALIVIGSIALAWLSTRYIEKPFRNPAKMGRGRIFAFSAAGMAGLGALCLLLISLGGWNSRFSEETNRYMAAAGDISPVRDMCVTNTIGAAEPACVLGADTEPSAIIWGDSHGVELGWALGELHGERGKAIIQRTRASCAPALGYREPRDPDCGAFNTAVFEEIISNRNIKTVYLAAFWLKDTYRDAKVDDLLGVMIEQLQAQNRKVVLIAPVPVQSASVPRALAMFGEDAPTASKSDYEAGSAYLTSRFPEWRARGVEIIDPATSLFAGERSIIVAGGKPLYFDEHHLSLAGARHVLAGAAID